MVAHSDRIGVIGEILQAELRAFLIDTQIC